MSTNSGTWRDQAGAAPAEEGVGHLGHGVEPQGQFAGLLDEACGPDGVALAEEHQGRRPQGPRAGDGRLGAGGEQPFAGRGRSVPRPGIAG
ncbi:hypothetical protein [Streptomyces hokutonensis]|uniref:hypothetical protein n=1 Tax=Streptomyces hokutonensis TaxID=1306990 RepID=UPI0033CAB668